MRSMLCRHVTIISAVWALVVVAFSAPTHAAPAAAGVIAFEGARLIVGDGSPAIENATVVVDGATIVQAGARREVKIPAGAQRVKLNGKTIMPAIIDTHLHVNQSRKEISQELRRLAYFGVGTAVSLGVDIQNAPFQVRANPLPGAARLLTAGRGITAPEPGRETTPYWVTTVAEARDAVRHNAAMEVDIIKLWVDDRNDKYEPLEPQLYGAVIEEAHQHGLQVSVHVVELDFAKGLLRAKVDAFAHSIRDRVVDDEFMALLREHPGLVLNPNLTTRGVPTDLSWLSPILSAAELQALQDKNVAQQKAQESFAIQAQNMVQMMNAGVRIVLGTDTSFDYAAGNTPWAVHIEMEDMAAAGMTPMQVIVAATHDAAAFIKAQHTGAIVAGKDADFIVLDANPLDDITNTRRISSVYLRGIAVDRESYP